MVGELEEKIRRILAGYTIHSRRINELDMCHYNLPPSDRLKLIKELAAVIEGGFSPASSHDNCHAKL